MNKFIAAEAAECIGCHACEIACAVAHNQENWPLSHSDFRPRIHVVGKGQAANPVACHHCNNAPLRLVRLMPTFQSDSVQLDEQKCIGCKRCAIACPGVVEMVDTIAQKCDLCNQRSSGTQACIEVCPTQALRLMDDKRVAADKGGPASAKRQQEKRHQTLSHLAVQRCSPLTRVKAQIKFQRVNGKPTLAKYIAGWIHNKRLMRVTAVFIVPKKLTATGIARCITLFGLHPSGTGRKDYWGGRTLPPDQFLTRNLRQGMSTGPSL